MRTSVVSTDLQDSASAGECLATEVQKSLEKPPAALVIFAAPQHDHQAMLSSVKSRLPNTIVVGASSAGEFTNVTSGQGLACAMGLVGDDVIFSSSLGHNLSRDAASAAREIVSGFTATPPGRFPFRSALVMADALAGLLPISR
jgi:methyl-accepting chemotaxis protein